MKEQARDFQWLSQHLLLHHPSLSLAAASHGDASHTLRKPANQAELTAFKPVYLHTNQL